MRSPLILELEKILKPKYGQIGYYYNVRHGKRIKYNIKIPFWVATDEELKAIKQLPHVVTAKNKISHGWKGSHECIFIYIDKRLSEIEVS
jgi:hypothetical protein